MIEAKIKDEAITISLKISELHRAVEGGWATGGIPFRLKVTDSKEFAKEVVISLNSEISEDGTNLIHKMFDEAIEAAYENGAEGVDMHEDQDG